MYKHTHIYTDRKTYYKKLGDQLWRLTSPTICRVICQTGAPGYLSDGISSHPSASRLETPEEPAFHIHPKGRKTDVLAQKQLGRRNSLLLRGGLPF